MRKLTKKYIDSLGPKERAYKEYDSRVPGFGVRVHPLNSKGVCVKTFFLRYSTTKIVKGELKAVRPEYVIGRYGPMTPTQAFERAGKMNVETKDGADPQADKKSKKDALSKSSTFGQTVDLFIERYAKPRQRTWKETKRTLEVNCADWLNRPIDSITLAEAVELLEGFQTEGKDAKARVTQAWLRTLFDWTVKRGAMERSIFESLGAIEIAPKVRDRIYTDDEIKSIWTAADTLGGVEGSYTKLILLLGVRRLELAGMTRTEFDDATEPTLWTVPHARVKIRKSIRTKRVYLVPLPPLAQRIIKTSPRLSEKLIFPAPRDNKKSIIPGTALQRRVRRLSEVSDWTFHGCRHTVATWLEDRGHSEYERGLILNHSSASVTAGYSHGYPLVLKRELLEKWADHVESVVRPQGVAILS